MSIDISVTSLNFKRKFKSYNVYDNNNIIYTYYVTAVKYALPKCYYSYKYTMKLFGRTKPLCSEKIGNGYNIFLKCTKMICG